MRRNAKFLFPILMAIFSLTTLSVKNYAKEQQETSTVKKQLEAIQKRYKHIDSKTGLRTSYYRAALPNSVPGGKRINVKEVHTHFTNKTALFLDVMAHTGTGPDPLDGIWRIAKPRQNIPGSTWLADVGTGTLTPEMIKYYKSNLEKLTKGNKALKIVMYCTADCWMAWNAVRRASNWGYSNILWFPEGTDEWVEAGHPVENSTPVPLEIDD
ncbi:MAG: rhodanese-like domain-containing protein [Hyphomicrobiales bacterium]